MSGTDSRSDRDLLIKLETQFSNMNENVSKIDRKQDDFIQRLEFAVKGIKDDLKNEYVTKDEFQRLADSLKSLKKEMEEDYTPLTSFLPVEEVHKDVAKRLRTLLITVGVCVLIAAASAPTWIGVYKAITSVQGVK